jgi:hypothetical protein
MGAEEDFAPFLENYLTEIPPGPEGDAQIRASLPAPITTLTRESVMRDTLTDEEIDAWFQYFGWNLWDVIRSRASEGESGLIPRQQYETLAFVQQWATYPALFRAMTEELGPEGVIALGTAMRTQVGSKVNFLRNWAFACPLFGRGIACALGLEEPRDRREDIETLIQFARRVMFGAWGEEEGGEAFCASRGYNVEQLEPAVLQRFWEDRETIRDPVQARAVRQFNAQAEIFGFLFHYDCRAGVNDTGPYATPDGGLVLVRDLFLNEPGYPWSQTADGLPYALTQAFFFAPQAPVEFVVNDLATVFTTPADYQKHVVAVTTYVRDTWDTPVADIRQIGPDERGQIAKAASAALMKLYAHIAGNDTDANLRAGIRMYAREMVMPHARAAGLWDAFVADGFDDIHPLTEEAWPTLSGPAAAEVLAPVLLLGKAFPSVRATVSG